MDSTLKMNDVRRPLPVEGFRLRLRPVVADDSEYIYALRTDPRYNAYLSPVSGGVDAQRHWIACYMEREAQGREVYFVIERRADARRCGVVRLYDIAEQQFTWGSWILDESKPSKAGLESAVLIYQIGFEHLQKRKAVFDVRRDNAHTISFHRRFGATETGFDEINIYFEYYRDRFFADLANYQRLLAK